MEKKQHVEVRLRAMEPEDLDMLYHIENDRSLWNISATNVPYSRYALHNYIADAKNDIYIDGQLRMMIENREQEIVGVIDLVNFDPKHRTGGNGYYHHETISPKRLCTSRYFRPNRLYAQWATPQTNLRCSRR